MFHISRVRLSLFSLLLLFLTLSACGGGGGSGSRSGSTTATGLFLDSAVVGLTFVSGNITGLTDSNGKFQYEIGNNVRFMIGDIVIGEAPGGSVITPVDLVSGSDASDPTVVNIVAFLLTLDDDNNPDNGIQISGAVRNLASGMSIDFAQSTTAFAADGNVQTVVSQLTAATAAGARILVASSFAQNHLSSTIWTLSAGSYSGNFYGNDTGTFDVTFSIDGSIAGTGVSNTGGGFSIQGQLSTDSTHTFTIGSTSTGASFTGTLADNGDLSGTWQNGVDTGRFTGFRTSSNGNNGEGAGGVYGSVTIQGSGLPSQFAPISGMGPSAGAADGFLQTSWTDAAINSLAVSIADNYQGLYGNDVHLIVSGQTYECQTGFLGSSGDCAGVSYDRITRVVTLSNVQLIGPGGSTAIINGSLNY